MLGIDLAPETIRIVRLRRRGGAFVVLRALEIDLTPEEAANSVLLGDKLAQTIRQNGWQREKAVMTLPRRACFLKYFDNAKLHGHGWSAALLQRSRVDDLLEMAQDSSLIPAEQLIFDFWSGPCGYDHPQTLDEHGTGILLAGAEKHVVEFCAEIAARSTVKVTALELRCLAAVNALLHHWRPAQDATIAVAYVDHNYADVALITDQAVISLQTLALEPPNSGSDSAPPIEMLFTELKRHFNTVKLSLGHSLPQKLFLAVSSAELAAELPGRIETLESKLGLQIDLCHPPQGFAPPDDLDAVGDLPRFLPALGAAADGLAATPIWFNFFHPRGRRTEKKREFSWRPLIFAVLGALIVAGAFWLSMVQQRNEQLRDLDRKIALTGPSRADMLNAKENWNLLRSYLPIRDDGGKLDGCRRECLRIFAEINRLFPDPNQAYVTNVSITDLTAAGATMPGTLGASDISIRGKVSTGDILPEFIDQLNNSAMFQEAKQAGSLTKDSTDSFYPFTFAVTCNLVRSSGGETP